MRDWSKPAATLLLGFGLAVFCFCVYLSNLPVNYTYDGMVFASRVEREDTSLYDLFHPHHLLYTILGRLVFLWGRDHGATWDGLVALQFFDLMTGVLGVCLAFHLLVRETDDRPMALLSAAGLGLSCSYWYFSTTPGVRIFATVTPLLAWYVLTYLRKAPPAFGWAVGLAHGLAVLGHQTNLLLIPAFLGGIACLPEKDRWERLKAAAYYLIGLTLVVLVAYAFVGRYICYRKTYESWLWWVFSYFHVQQWGGHLQPAGFESGKGAMVQAFLRPNLSTKDLGDFLTFGAAKTIFQYGLWTLLALLLLRLGHFWNHRRQVLWVALLWLVAYVPFFVWWEPWNIEFWVSSTVPCWVLMGLVASDLSQRWSSPVLHFANRVVLIVIWSSIIGLLFVYNFQGNILRTAENTHGHRELLGALDWKVRVDDLLVLDGLNTIPFYIERYQKRDYLSLHSFLKKYKLTAKDLTPVPTPEASVLASQRMDQAWTDLTGIFQATWKRHRKVWALVEAVDGTDPSLGHLERIMKLREGRIKDFFMQFELRPVTYHGKLFFYEVIQPVPDPGLDADDATADKTLPRTNAQP